MIDGHALAETYEAAWRATVTGARTIANDESYTQVMPVCLVVSEAGELLPTMLVNPDPGSHPVSEMQEALAGWLRENRAQAMVFACEATTASLQGVGDAAYVYGRCLWDASPRVLTALIDRSLAPGQRWREDDVLVPAHVTAWLDDAWSQAQA